MPPSGSSHEVPLALLLAPVGKSTVGDLLAGIECDEGTEGKEADLVTATNLILGNATGDPTDLNTAGGQGEDDAVNGSGLRFGIDEHG